MIEIYCDGGARGNPGPAAWGFVVYIDNKVIKEQCGYIGIATNNIAEYTALVKALQWLGKEYKNRNLIIYLDSQLVVSQLSGLYKVKNANLRELIFQIRQTESYFGEISYRHIPRNLNKNADKLVNRALDEKLNIVK
ncbi:hypothetical protein A3F02_00125 [Candidatus Curtissbacteria bacterium RIFCSPHIGHO2_12_FULL_38_9b]|uniref:RNase H type-1 domain-containing protein n=2 Tax=Candidatus Curtissiibacteriota TaxID=1752717 RepID=A0A1F5GXH6_9BACT|nr:MAG: hypothetical protein A3A48_03075 [Candidatus Curtissbacteria bacterium RIFCSPLOWO2_01_FULL_37_9]OGD96477.1 MAG: hypothetical protein A3F02_00125 [Candidatus Curtissbacteria bacterium RIFCSPHIGHO2_12_FULL_38_9b]